MEKKRTGNADILEECGCLRFIEKHEETFIAGLECSVQDAFRLLDDSAVKALRKTLRQRLLSLYIQPLMLHINKAMQRYDPVGVMLGRTDPEALRKAAADVLRCAEENAGGVDIWLHEQYPLLETYTQSVRDNTAAALREFLERVVSRKVDISSLLPENKPFERITGLSTGGADMHRHGRCVIGVTTDAGVFYYKPHDCRIDALYERIVSKWFSDCTEAPRVLEGDGYAFISALVHTPVQSEAQIAEYYRNFGILTALFHGLGSSDMHQENIMACGTRPSAIDLETLLNLSAADRAGQTAENRDKTVEEFALSVMRTGVLPARIYKRGLISPLYCTDDRVSCLPVYDGKRVTVEGYENDFLEGFSEGYERMLAHREEIKAMLDEYRGSTLRIVVRNTVYYAHICAMLHQPKYMVSEEARRKVYDMLGSPFTASGAEPDREFVEYEWKCVLQGDIPYYCTALDRFDLCGEDPDETVKQGYYKRSAIQATIRFLDRLSPEEERFELDIIRTAFAHAPLDVPKPEGKTALAVSPAGKDTLAAEVRDIYAKLKADTVRCTDGSPMWIATAETLAGNMAVGRIAALSDAGRFLAELVLSGLFTDVHDEAMVLSEECTERIVSDLRFMNETDLGTESPVFPAGLFGGAGSQLLSLLKMSEAGIAGADEAVKLLINALAEKNVFENKKNTAAEGSAGLITALAAVASFYKESDPGLYGGITAVLRSRADSLAEAQPPERADMPYGSVGYGAAFAAAYGVLGEQKYAECAEKMFKAVEEEYSTELGGWCDFEAKSKRFADKGPHAAGIFLAADYAQERLGAADSAVSRVRELALSSMLAEENLYHADTLAEGNALTALALLKAGEREAAGRLLEAMRQRAEKNGCYQVTEPGIRSFFDPSLIHGTLGCGAAMIRYIKQ
ncbi:MAG: DUF4135 domain-containing protein [Ruminiclostridium sp.]|nr:DUF4135 domain-containing protein [Ruminiclostridium sp.]